MLCFALNTNAQQPEGTLGIAIQHMVNDRELNTDTAVYKNSLGQTYTIGNFKYYIGNITLINTNGKDYHSDAYFLITEDDEHSKKIMLEHIPAGAYTGIRFIIGVDSLHNCSGAQSGALDPANAMFWEWNTGYIFLKLEGKSPASTAPGKIIEYHIGGYRSPSNCIRAVELKFGQPLITGKEKMPELQLSVNIAEILQGPEAIDFSTLPAVTDFHNATGIADNYKDMFSIKTIYYAQ